MAGGDQNADAFGHSLTDLMTSIAVIFILFFLAFVDSKQKEFAERESRTVTNREELFEALLEAFPEDTGDVTVLMDPNDPLSLEIVLTQSQEALEFNQGDHDLSESGEDFLRGFVPTLTGIVCSDLNEPRVDSIVIEGHTSGEGNADKNTVLSALRATEVMKESHKILDKIRNEPNKTGDEMGASNDSECFMRLARSTGRGDQARLEYRLDRSAPGPTRAEFRERDLFHWAGRKPVRYQELVAEYETPSEPPLKIEDGTGSRRVVVKVRVKSMEAARGVLTRICRRRNGWVRSIS